MPSRARAARQSHAPKRGGTIVVGSVREPACLNAFLIRCGDTADIGHLMAPAIRGAFKVGPGLKWQPDLATAEITKTPPFTVTYRIGDDARWSDGVPVTAGDFVFTHETRRAHADELINFEKEQLRVIRSVRAVDPKTVEHYRPNWNAYRYRPAESRRLLAQAGCRRGRDGIYECAGERLSLRFGTPVDDPLAPERQPRDAERGSVRERGELVARPLARG